MNTKHTQRRSQPARRIIIRLALGLASLVGAGGVWWALVATKPEPMLVSSRQQALAVRVIPASEREVTRAWRGYGTARALAEANVAAQVAGVVVHRPDAIDAGVWVDKGDLLVELDSGESADRLAAATEAIRSLQAQLESLDVEKISLVESTDLAEQAVALSERELARAVEAQKSGAATVNEIDKLKRDLTRLEREASDLRQRRDQIPSRRQQLEAQIRQQRASVRLSQLEVDRSRITAPISGLVQEISVDVGDWVGVGKTIARLVNLGRIEAPIHMPVSAVADIGVGDAITLKADGPSGLQWSGQIVRLAPEIDPQTRAITVFTEIDQNDRTIGPGTLRPGQFLVGVARSGRAEPRIIVPRNAIDGDRVAIIGADGTVEKHRVQVAFHLDEKFPELDGRVTQWAALSGGLKPGDLVIVSNLDELEEGLPVRASGGAIAGGALSDAPSRTPSVRQ